MIRLLKGSLLILAALTPLWAQDAATAEQQRVEELRQQLRDVTDKQAQLQAREEQLDEALRPENVERSVAGIGTTDATALRDRRREQLEREKAVVDEQLRSLSTSRARLEASIASAEAEAVRLRASALGANNSPPVNSADASANAVSPPPTKRNARRGVKRRKSARARRTVSSRRD
jgi:ABC-type phosphate transport system auxiliary subunit